MRTHRRRARTVLACLAVTLAVPASAGAMLLPADPPGYVGQTPDLIAQSLPQPTEIRTVTVHDGTHTLPLVLAAAALAVALGGSAYVAFRVRPQLRS
jgi:hypothetical protein